MDNSKIYTNIKIKQVEILTGTERYWEMHNLVPSTGLDIIRDAFAGLTTKAPHLVEIGSGTTAPYSTDNALQSPTTVAITMSTYTLIPPGGISYTATVGTTVGAGSKFHEIGLLSATSYLYSRSLIEPGIIKTSSNPTVENITYECIFTPTEAT